MVRRISLDEPEDGGLYFEPSPSLEFFSSGCALLDCVLGGGWCLGRISNIVGDRSSGKTLLGIEATANFLRAFPKGRAYYREAEAAFDESYAKHLGMPIDKVDFLKDRPLTTVEDFYEDLDKEVLPKLGGDPGLYILDSLDALSDQAELKREFDEASFGGTKAKQMGALFRRLVQKVENKRLALLIISQVRDNIGVAFGEKHTRTGGKALDFYASIVLWLSHKKTLDRTVNKVKRPTGVLVKAKCKKNKISLPMRECEFPIVFAYGVDDVRANVDWLESIGRLDVLDLTPGKAVDQFFKDLAGAGKEEFDGIRTLVAGEVKQVWKEVESSFLTERRKY